MRDRSALMMKISEIGFALYDLILFLDTHPEDNQAFALYEEYQKQYKELRSEYISMYGPLTAFDVNTGRPCSCNDSRYRKFTWSWGEAPMPWEGGC
ncbi:MAG: spore coat protein CotJB [Lachnospiraceae bacterium]|nr:spore coat protein CotJB [Lachnospiraceae bacterium]